MLRLRENERKIRRGRRLAGEVYTIVFIRAKTTRERSQVSKLQRETSAKGLSELYTTLAEYTPLGIHW